MLSFPWLPTVAIPICPWICQLFFAGKCCLSLPVFWRGTKFNCLVLYLAEIISSSRNTVGLVEKYPEKLQEITLEIWEYMPVRSSIICWYGKHDEMLSQGGYLSLGWWYHHLIFTVRQIYSDTWWGKETPGEMHPKTQGNPNSMRHKLRFN